MRILFTGGGSGGHIFPIIAVCDKLKETIPGSDFFYVGTPDIYEAELIKAGIKIKSIVSAKLRRYFDFRNFIDIPKFLFSIFQAFWKVFWIMPDVLFSKGGTGSFAVVLACWFYRVPIIIQDSDSIPGAQNLLSARFSDRIAISYDVAADSFVNLYKKEIKRQLMSEKIALTGNPVRNMFLTDFDLNQETAKKVLELDPNRKLLLVISGSQGSIRINDFFLDTAPDLLKEGFQIYHQTGVNNLHGFNNELKLVLEKLPKEYQVAYKTMPFLDGKLLKDAMAAADLIVSRSGSFIFEIAAIGKPSVLIPLPESAADHQKKNAYEYAKIGAAIVIEEENLTPHLFLAQVNKIFGNQENYNAMSLAAKKFAKPNATKLLAEEIIKLGNKG
ncbi:MAG: UDP-N-acetylglucosamine--N-acetylmuramyl-(pentapeptide) pyrophosphoryl-undecaprenol N-acetylglucosamine transferase [Patescibacteria group bacterium]